MNQTDCEQIHEASLALLEDPGVRFEHDLACRRLLAAGAQAGDGPQVIRLPREMVAEFLALAPRKVTLADRAGGGHQLSPDSPPRYWTCPTLFIEEQGNVTPATSDGLARICRLGDALENVHGLMGLALDDVPPAARDFVGLRIMAENTRKHLRALCFGGRGIEAMLEMQPVLGGGPWFSVGFTAHGPLRWTHLALDIFLRSAGHGIPVTINGEPMAGVSGPVTLAGSLAVGNAEILSGIVLNQVLEPRRPCIHNLGLAHVMDMRRALAVTGGPENALLAAAGAALGRFYGIPSASWVSTESMLPDAQAGLEKMCGFLTHAQAGVNLTWGMGQLESELTISPAQMVIDDEMVPFIRHYLQGFPVNESSLALDLTRAVGIAGNFLDTEHTLRHYRESLFHPALLCRERRAKWREDGARDLARVAAEKAESLMARPVQTMNEDQRRTLRAIEQRRLAEASYT